MNPYNPFLNIWSCVTRKTRAGETFYPEEKISREDALRMYTTGAAWIQWAEKNRGSLEVGKYADLVVIDRDFMKVPEAELKDIQPLQTIVNGKIVYEKR